MMDVQRSRWVREVILGALWQIDGVSIGLSMSFEQIAAGFARQRREVSESDLRRELNDLVDDKLVKRTWDEDLGCHMHAIDSRGREFVKAAYPWERIDEFTGGRP